MPTHQFGTRGTESRMSRGGKGRIPAQPADNDDALAMLWHTIVSGIHLAQMNTIPCINQWREQIQHVGTTIAGQEALDILENECDRAEHGDNFGKAADQCIPLVARTTQPGGRETLTRWPTDNDIYGRERYIATQIVCSNMGANIRTVGFHGSIFIIDRANKGEPRSRKAQGQATSTAKKIKNRMPIFHSTNGYMPTYRENGIRVERQQIYTDLSFSQYKPYLNVQPSELVKLGNVA